MWIGCEVNLMLLAQELCLQMRRHSIEGSVCCKYATCARLVLIMRRTQRRQSTHSHARTQLGWQAGDEGNLLLAEAQGTPKVGRETATQLMFETFNVAGLFIADEPVLSLYAHGKLTGCVIDFGHGKTGPAL